MSKKINKEKEGITIRFSVRLPKEQHKWLKEQSLKTKGTNNFISMNDYISIGLKLLKNNMPQ